MGSMFVYHFLVTELGEWRTFHGKKHIHFWISVELVTPATDWWPSAKWWENKRYLTWPWRLECRQWGYIMAISKSRILWDTHGWRIWLQDLWVCNFNACAYEKDMMYIDLRRTTGLFWSPPYMYICRDQFEWGKSWEPLRSSWAPIFQTHKFHPSFSNRYAGIQWIWKTLWKNVGI